jgi:hypothetical protein
MIATIAFTAMGSPAPTLPDAWIVAIGIASSGRVGTIALRECDRRAAGVVRRDCAAAFGRSSPTSPTRTSLSWSAGTAQRARVEDRIRDDKDTGLAKFPFKEFALNEVWLEIVMLAHDLIVWTQTLLLDGELAKAEPKRLRYQLLHIAGRLAFHSRKARLHLQGTWPWTGELVAAFARLKALPAAAG